MGYKISSVLKMLLVFSLGWISGSLFFAVFMFGWNPQLSEPVSRDNNFMAKHNSRAHSNTRYHPNSAIDTKVDIKTENLIADSAVRIIQSLEKIPGLRGNAAAAIPTQSLTTPTAEIEEKVIPVFKRNETYGDDEGEKTWIILDFPVDDRLFTLENYKALESMLNVYSDPIVRVFLAAPNDAYSHKIGNQLSVSHFSKYKKRGYDIDTLPVAKMNKGFLAQIGQKYWQKWSMECCDRCGQQCRISDHVQPYHVLNYIRLNKLWRRGGLFSDFSFFFLGTFDLPKFRQGYIIHSYCNESSQEAVEFDESFHSQKCFTSTMMVFNEPKSEAILCILKKYEADEFLNCLDADVDYGGANCVHDAFDECFETLSINNDLDQGEQNPVEMFNGDPGRAAQVAFSTDWKLKKHIRAFWLGHLAWRMQWNTLPYPEGTLLATATDTLKLKHAVSSSGNYTCKISCSRYTTSLSYLADMGINSTYGVGIEQASCAPSIIVPGFMKSASTFLFSAIAAHPQVLRPLKGSQLKETHCYHPQPPVKLKKRSWCFPFLEENDNFASIDGTVYYSTDPTVPYALKQDNPNVKAVFAVRHPVDRIYSNYRFAFETYGNKGPFDNLTLSGTSHWDKFGVLRDMVINGTSDDVIVDYYYNQPFKSGGALGVLFMHSIVFPAILHYRKVLGEDKVMVVTSSDLDTRNFTRVREVMDKVYAFLGLCPYQLQEMEPALQGRGSIPLDKEMSQDVYNKLNKFFEPFNDALSRVIGRNLTHWNHKSPPSSASRYSYGLNQSLPLQWFEVVEHDPSESGILRNGIMSHLLPKTTTDADSSFNTTLGMLISF